MFGLHLQGELGTIAFSPSLDKKILAAKKMGFGAVIKLLMYFDEELPKAALADEKHNHAIEDAQFIMTDEEIPTWWTQLPEASNLLTGWLSGPKAEKLKTTDDDAILEMALQSLSKIFKTTAPILKKKLQWHKIYNWTNDSFTRGSYSYSTLDTDTARQVMIEPQEHTLFFAGEALYNGPEMGTVEAALTSGEKVAEMILGG